VVPVFEGHSLAHGIGELADHKRPHQPLYRGEEGNMPRNAAAIAKTHPVKVGLPITYEVSGHPPRADSATYQKSREALKKIAASLGPSWYFASGNEPYQDHHGGGLWLKDGDGWFFVRNLVGIEWASQFCADPKKIDELRRNAERLYARFPESIAALKELGLDDCDRILREEIKTADDVSRWTDSIFNASVPLPQRFHTGFVPKGGGVHNYPTPVVDIDRFRYDDFRLWVSDDSGSPAAVVPVAPPDSADRRVRVLHATPGTKLHQRLVWSEANGEHLELAADHDLAKQAFARSNRRRRQK
jgi:hypothetical protein